MQVEITERAVEELQMRKILKEGSVLFISHETEGLGCVVNGVSDLVAVQKSSLPPTAVFLDTKPESWSVAIDKKVDWIYDESLKIDFNDTASSFQLKSPNQMLNPRMTLREEAEV
ncbi:iron-sulfur cluster biosynthesis family protein [Alkalicoccus halolimnae]|uniref:Iron-sulfur cluster biosynthesis family protein n=1 Tax=Alkalicoccus halolimnae TaxID=1667239 RepID=A0AAJ8LYU6_9BACI|nr:iron-sulfur cluster biosynthesis family protein [Alkalicoccus halolimnae]